MSKHSCSYQHDGLQCPKLGIYSDSAHVEPEKDPKWWCAWHYQPNNRGHEYADKQALLAIMEDLRTGRAGRGTAVVARETDALIDQELARLCLRRRPGESRIEFVARCRAAMKTGRIVYPVTDAERQALLEAGEDPGVAS